MTNSSSGTVVQAATDAQGVASFLLPEGIYEAAATDRRSVEGYTYTLNALQSNVVVSAASWSEGMTVDLNLVASRAGQILIKEIYSGGCQKDDGSGPTSSTSTWSSATTRTSGPRSATSASA